MLAMILYIQLLKNMFCFPLLVLKGIYHYWKYCYFSRWLEQMEVYVGVLVDFGGVALVRGSREF